MPVGNFFLNVAPGFRHLITSFLRILSAATGNQGEQSYSRCLKTTSSLQYHTKLHKYVLCCPNCLPFSSNPSPAQTQPLLGAIPTNKKRRSLGSSDAQSIILLLDCSCKARLFPITFKKSSPHEGVQPSFSLRV